MAFSFDDAKRMALEFMNKPVSNKPDAPTVLEESWDLIKTVGIAVSVALVLRIVLFQPFNIPSGSMKPTLLVGDYLFVSKYTYGYSRASLIWPFTRMGLDGRTPGGMPTRGDVAVFKNPENGTRAEYKAVNPTLTEAQLDERVAKRANYMRDYIKRVIGLPGDTIEMRRGVLHINGEPVIKEFIGEERFNCGTTAFASYRMAPMYRETLPNGVSYTVAECAGDNGSLDNRGPFTVPEGNYFMMGDNRDGSDDSRASVGFVPSTLLVGKAEMIFFSADGEKAQIWQIWNWPFAVRYGRIASGVR